MIIEQQPDDDAVLVLRERGYIVGRFFHYTDDPPQIWGPYYQ